MLVEFEEKVAVFAKENGLFSSADRVLLAVSGGADSIALLYAMHKLRAEKVFDVELFCAHVHHQLRSDEADLDEEFVIAQAAQLKLPVTTRKVDVRDLARKNKLSIETAARKLRIQSLLDIAIVNKCNRIATGHQKNDNAETILHRLLRGTGFRGLAGIWPARVLDGTAFCSNPQNANPDDKIQFVRPLLDVTRDEIIDYLRDRNLKFRQDHTNADCTYRRNYIRHRQLPALQQDCTSSIVEELSQLAQSARRFHDLVGKHAEQAWSKLADTAGDNVILDLTAFFSEPEPVRIELIRRSLTTVGSGERDLTQQHYKRILKLAEQNITGGEIELPHGFTAWREYGNLIFAQHKPSFYSEKQVDQSVNLQVPGRARLGNYLIEATIFEADQKDFERFRKQKDNLVEWFDFEKIQQPLIVRSRRTADKFWPLGLPGEKKVGKFLTAEKVPRQMRKKLLIVADSEKIIWVCPIRMSRQAAITRDTRKVLQLKITDTAPKDSEQ